MTTGQVACNDTSSLLIQPSDKSKVVLKNTGTDTVFIGESGVAITDGFTLKANEQVEFVGVAYTPIHAVLASTETTTVVYLLAPIV